MSFGVHTGIGGRIRRNARDNKSDRRVMGEINVTPFVDVMLVLLVIFMITAPLMTAGVTVELPETEASTIPGQDEPLAISVDKNGDIYIQKTRVDLDELAPKLKAIVGRKKDTRIFVFGDKQVKYGKVMEVIANIHSAGFTKVAFVTDNSKGSNGSK